MNWFLRTATNHQPESDGGGVSRSRPANPDSNVLDAYSMAVVGVVQSVAPAVISITGRSPRDRGGSGSGFIVTADGYAVTNSHVVGGRTQLTAETHDGDRVDADVIGDDPATDIALLRLAGRDLPSVSIGDSAVLAVGQLVIAMGSPLGLQSTVSTGIVSATGRSMRSQTGRMIESVIQHSAPINPGNSGGPLLNSRGQVIGVNTAIIFQAQGIGFAVPANTAQWVTSEILAYGQVRRRELGIAAGPVHVARAAVVEFDLLADQAISVSEVARGSAAHNAGIRPGDILTTMNGRIVETVDDVHRLLAIFPLDKPIEVEVLRDGRKVDIRLFAD